jgi:hypothetical protein
VYVCIHTHTHTHTHTHSHTHTHTHTHTQGSRPRSKGRRTRSRRRIEQPRTSAVLARRRVRASGCAATKAATTSFNAFASSTGSKSGVYQFSHMCIYCRSTIAGPEFMKICVHGESVGVATAVCPRAIDTVSWIKGAKLPKTETTAIYVAAVINNNNFESAILNNPHSGELVPQFMGSYCVWLFEPGISRLRGHSEGRESGCKPCNFGFPQSLQTGFQVGDRWCVLSGHGRRVFRCHGFIMMYRHWFNAGGGVLSV